MSNIEFIWDPKKASLNLKKHGVSFEEALSVFYDENARHMPDPTHSDDEDRFLLLGISAHLKMLVVCHCYRDSDSTIRIISARKATATERKAYKGAL